MAKRKTKQAASSNKQQQLVVNQMIIKSPSRKTSDIGSWRNALRSADMGRPKVLFELYEDLILDGVLSEAVSKRIEAVTNSELTFQDADGESNDEIAELMDTPAWEDLLTEIMNAKFWGRSALEFDFSDGFEVKAISPKHIDISRREILINDSDPSGISYENDDHILVIGKNRDFGLFLRTAPLAIWKRGGFGDYAQWLEIFGMPQRVGKYSSYDPESRKLLEEAMERSGSAPWIVVPNEANVETVQNTGSGSSGTTYNEFRQACNEEMLVTILGQTLTTISGDKGARSLGEVHKQGEEGKNKSDMRFVQRILNCFVIDILEKRGFPVSGGRFVFPEAAEALSVADIVSLCDIMDIPTSFLHDKYSIPSAKDGEVIAGSKRNLPIAALPEPQAAPDTEPVIEVEDIEYDDITNADKSILKTLRSFFAYAPTAWSGAAQQYSRKWTSSIMGKISLADANEDNYSIDVASLFKKALEEIYSSKEQILIQKNLFEISNTAYQDGIEKEFNKMGLEFGKKNETFINQFKKNAAVMAAFKNHIQTKEIVESLIDQEGNLRSFSAFKKVCQGIEGKYNNQWLKTEYNTAVRSARQASNWLKYQEAKHLYPNLEYMESKAVSKREWHADWVGTILPLEHEWWDTHFPPSDWNCQCWTRQTDSPATTVPMGDNIPVFRNNPAKTAEFIKIDETPFYKASQDKEAVIQLANELFAESERNRIKYAKKKFKSGGWIEIPIGKSQNKQEEKKNLKVYTILAKEYGQKYRLLAVVNLPKIKNPDAFNVIKNCYSDAKITSTANAKNAIQNSIKEASKQKVSEVVIQLEYGASYKSIKDGLKASFQAGRAKTIKEIIIIEEKGNIRKYNEVSIEKIRLLFEKYRQKPNE